MLESEMYEPFWHWLVQTRRIRSGTRYARELPWLGRRVDLATLTAAGALTSYEFKVSNTLRAIEQAAYNAQAFGRSYIVTMSRPTWRNLELASIYGVGVIVMGDGKMCRLSAASPQPASPATRRLREIIRKRGVVADV